jgi:hypothetical protein
MRESAVKLKPEKKEDTPPPSTKPEEDANKLPGAIEQDAKQFLPGVDAGAGGDPVDTVSDAQLLQMNLLNQSKDYLAGVFSALLGRKTG